jgi:ABC-2 type transport system ATP-binding protein
MSENAIVVGGLRKRFGNVVALDGINLDVPAGAVFGLLGPNGAGKTTIVRVLATVLRPDGGRAEVFGQDVVREPAAVRRRIGLAGQAAAVVPTTPHLHVDSAGDLRGPVPLRVRRRRQAARVPV